MAYKCNRILSFN